MTREELIAADEALRDPGTGSIADALERLVPSPGARAAVAARLAVSSAYELDDQDAATLAEGATRFGDFPSHGVAGGNDGIALALAERLGGAVRTSTAVSRVAWSEHGVVVRAGDAEVAADACVIATPAPHALELEWDPPLPGWKRRGARGRPLRPGGEALPALSRQRRRRARRSPCRSASGPGPSTRRRSRPRSQARPRRSSGSRSTAGRRNGRRPCAALRPDLDYADGPPLLSTWHDDPWARGAYSVRTLSSPLADEALARPVGPVAFAGEHTAGRWHALMEGALRSGLRAAAELA